MPPAMEIIFVRHAQPETGQGADPPLSSVGERQATLLAESATTWPRPTEILMSPTLRTRQTARSLAQALGIEPEIAPWLEEIQMPLGQGSGTRTGDGVPDERTFREFSSRVADGLISALGARGVDPATRARPPSLWNVGSGEHRILLVGHGGANAVALEMLLGIESVPWAFYRFSFVHTAIARLKAFPVGDGSVFSLIKHGQVSHLPTSLRSY